MLSNDVPTTPRPRPPGNVRRSASMKMQTPPPPYASSLAFSREHAKVDIQPDHLASPDDSVKGEVGHALSPICLDERKDDWFNDTSHEELTELLMKADGLIRQRENELNLTTAVCKSLYENNVSLKSKHQALLSRIPKSPTLSSSVLPSPLSPSTPLPLDSNASSPQPSVYSSSTSPPQSTKPGPRFQARKISMSPDDIAQLADQNAELLLKLEKLEEESAQADISGRRALKRLEREIQVLKDELEESQARGEELEEKARLGENIEAIWRKKEREEEARKRRSKLTVDEDEDEDVERRDFAPPSVLPKSTFRVPKSRRSEPILEHPVPSRLEVLKEQQRDSDGEDRDSSPPTFEEVDRTMTSSMASSSPSRPSPVLISELLTKIAELEETNAKIMQRQAETTEKLQAVQQETENISRVYERLGEKGDLRWVGEDGETALYFQEGDDEELSQELGETPGIMRFRSWRRTIEGQSFYDPADGEFDQSTIRSTHKSYRSISDRDTPSRPGSVKRRFASSESLSRSHNRVPRTMSLSSTTHKSRKSVLGLFDPPMVDRPSPTLSTLTLETSSQGGGLDSREPSMSPSGAPTLDAELGGLGFPFDTPGPAGVHSRGPMNHHFRTSSLFDLSCVGSTATTPMHSPSPSLSHNGANRNSHIISPTPFSATLPARAFVFPTRNQTVDDPTTPMSCGGLSVSVDPPTPEISREVTDEPNNQGPGGLLPTKESKHSLRYRRMTQTVRSRAEKVEDGRFKESLKGLGPAPGKPVVRSIRRKKSTLANAFDVFMEAFSNTVEKREGDGSETPSVDVDVDDASPVPELGNGSSSPLSEDESEPSGVSSTSTSAVNSVSPQQDEVDVQHTEVSPPSQERRGLTRVVLEVWLWLQFAVIVVVFLWAMAKRGPKAVLYEAEKRKGSSSQRPITFVLLPTSNYSPPFIHILQLYHMYYSLNSRMYSASST